MFPGSGQTKSDMDGRGRGGLAIRNADTSAEWGYMEHQSVHVQQANS